MSTQKPVTREPAGTSTALQLAKTLRQMADVIEHDPKMLISVSTNSTPIDGGSLVTIKATVEL